MHNVTIWCMRQMEAGNYAPRNVLKTVRGVLSTNQSRDRELANIKIGNKTPSGMFQEVSQTGYIV